MDARSRATAAAAGSSSRLMQSLGRRYVQYVNRFYRRTGSLWEGRYKSSLVQAESYLLACQRYIELNPLRAGMVTDPGDYRWSSYGAHAFGVHARLWTPHPLYLGLGNNQKARQKGWRELIKEPLDVEVLSKIRHCAHTGLVLGTELFREQVHNLRN